MICVRLAVERGWTLKDLSMPVALPELKQQSQHKGSLMSRLPGNSLLAPALVFTVALLLVCVLPLFVPMRPIRTESTSYLVGFNNQVAVLVAAGLSFSVFLATCWIERGFVPVPLHDGRKLTAGFISAVIAGSSLVLSFCGAVVAASHHRYLGDAGYIIEVATVKQETGRALYSQIEFAYGPLLVYPEIWLSRLCHISMTAAYYIILPFESAVGLLMLAYVLNAVPTRGRLRRAAFVLLALGAITPHLGLNYTYLRFASPLAILIFGMRQPSLSRCVLVFVFGECLELSISPEIGLAMFVGVLVFGALKAWVSGWRWLMAALVPFLVLGVVLLTLGQPFLRSATNFSRGALNLPVGPYPHILVFLFATVWLVPVALGRFGRLRDPIHMQLLALFAVSVAFLPSALGRCDPLHVLFNGIGMLCVSLAALANSSQRACKVWVGCLAVLVLWNHWVNERLFDVRNAEVIGQAILPHLPAPAREGLVSVIGLHRPDLAARMNEASGTGDLLDMTALEQLTKGQPVATPVDLTPHMEEQLKATRQYVPGYFTFYVNLMNPAAEQRLNREIERYRWVLMPSLWHPGIANGLVVIRRLQGFSLPYHQRNPSPYVPGQVLQDTLDRDWVPIRYFNKYVLYERLGAEPSWK